MRIDASPLPLSPPPANDPARIDKVARQMEGLFAQLMIKQMRETAMGDAMFPGAAGQFRDLYDEQLAKTLTEGRGLGLQAMIAKQLQQQAGGSSVTKADIEALPLSLAGSGARAMLPLDAYVRPLAAKPVAAANEARPLAMAALTAEPKRTWIPAEDVPRMMPAVRELRPAAAKPSGHPDTSGGNPRVEAFVAKVWPHAQKIGRELGVDPRAIVAQAALETGWGRSTISARGETANNYFGIKATGAWRGDRVSTNTQEFAEGGFRTERAAFRAYDGVEQSFADYAALLKKSPRYAAALNAGGDIRGFASALQRGGYATDPAYARKIEAIATGPTMSRALARLDIDDATGPAAPAARHTLFAAGFGGVGGL